MKPFTKFLVTFFCAARSSRRWLGARRFYRWVQGSSRFHQLSVNKKLELTASECTGHVPPGVLGDGHDATGVLPPLHRHVTDPVKPPRARACCRLRYSSSRPVFFHDLVLGIPDVSYPSRCICLCPAAPIASIDEVIDAIQGDGITATGLA